MYVIVPLDTLNLFSKQWIYCSFLLLPILVTRIKLVKPEMAEKVTDMILSMASKGAIKSKLKGVFISVQIYHTHKDIGFSRTLWPNSSHAGHV